MVILNHVSMSDDDESLTPRDDEGFSTIFVLKPDQIRAKYLFHAQLSEEVQDFEELKINILHLVNAGQALSDSERKLFLLAFKNCVGSRRKAWRVLVQQEQDVISKNNKSSSNNSGPSLLPHLRLYKSEIELEIENVCDEMLKAIDTLLNVPKGQLNTTEKVFYWKLRGDYSRYLCEFQQGSQREKSSRQALDAYNQAKDVVQGPLGLRPSDPQLLGLALNMSVFHYEILGNQQEGLELCRSVYQDAENHLRNVDENEIGANVIRSAKDVLKLLRDNLNLWEQEQLEGKR